MGEPSDLEWLLQNGGAVVRWRAAALLGIETSSRDLLASPQVQTWLARLNLNGFDTPLDRLDEASLARLGTRVHGSKPTCLENVLGKLAEFGLRAGMPDLDEHALPLMAIFRWQTQHPAGSALYERAWEHLTKSIIAWGLLRLGYPPDDAMQAYLKDHLRLCAQVARDQVYDLYAPQHELPGLPKAWRGKPILRPEVMARYWLPYVHDLFTFANLPSGLLDDQEEALLDTWIRYILDPRFQALREGYGYAWVPERHACYAWGWSPHLPGFNGFDSLASGPVTPLLSRLELLARLPAGRTSSWLCDALSHLDNMRAPSGRLRFPSQYLHEGSGYYVSGYGMGLDENRHAPSWAEFESTLRMRHIQSLLS